MGITKEQLEQDYQSGLSMSEVGRKHGISTTAVFRRMKKLGIVSRPPSQAMKGKSCPPEIAAKISAAHKGKVFTEEHRNNISESKKGEKNPNYGKKARHTKRIWHQQPDSAWICMRSNWEAAYAHYLDAKGVQYQYEPETFVLSNGRAYTPDFLLLEAEEYIEIKGWYRPEHREKLEQFLREHPDKKLILADRTYLESLGIDLKQLFVSTRPKFACEQCGKKFYRIYRTQRMCSRECRNKYIACHRKKRRS